MNEPMQLKDAIIREMVRAVKQLGAKSDLLGVVCSYGETYSDEQVLDELREWNQFVTRPNESEPKREKACTEECCHIGKDGECRLPAAWEIITADPLCPTYSCNEHREEMIGPGETAYPYA